MSSLSPDTISESQKNTWSWFYKNIDFDKMEQPSNDLSVSGVCDNFMVSFYDSVETILSIKKYISCVDSLLFR